MENLEIFTFRKTTFLPERKYYMASFSVFIMAHFVTTNKQKDSC